MTDPEQQQLSDDCSSSGQDSCHSSSPGDCPPIVNCSKSQTRIDFERNSEEVRGMLNWLACFYYKVLKSGFAISLISLKKVYKTKN